MNPKRALLIAGGGTLGSYTYPELLRLGWQVDVLDLLPHTSYIRGLKWIQASGTDEVLKELFTNNHYDVIVDFVHHEDPERYRLRGELLLQNTRQLVFLSSYRVYSDDARFVNEDTPFLLDTSTDEYLLRNETYAIPKAYNERWLRSSPWHNWTIIRPMISFSHYRLDLVDQGAPTFFLRSLQGKKTVLPRPARFQTAGVGWAGNVGKMIARLCGNERAFGEAFTLGLGEEQTWNDVAEIYREMIGAEYVWTDDLETYMENCTPNAYTNRCTLLHDRLLDRHVDISKVLSVTGLQREELLTTREGILYELNVLAERPDLVARFDTELFRAVNEKMDAYLQKLES